MEETIIKVSVISRVIVPGVGEYLRVQAAQEQEFWLAARNRYSDGTYFAPIRNVSFPQGSVTEVPEGTLEINVALLTPSRDMS